MALMGSSVTFKCKKLPTFHKSNKSDHSSRPFYVFYFRFPLAVLRVLPFRAELFLKRRQETGFIFAFERHCFTHRHRQPFFIETIIELFNK